MLNSEQREMVESSVWVVNTALKRQGLERDKDLKQDALLYMCQCAERFDKTQGVKWTTYAYKNVYLFIKRTHAKEAKRLHATVNIGVYDLNEDAIAQFNENLYDNPTYKLESFIKTCNDQQKEILLKKLEGYTCPEIAVQINATHTQVTNRIRDIQQKARELEL